MCKIKCVIMPLNSYCFVRALFVSLLVQIAVILTLKLTFPCLILRLFNKVYVCMLFSLKQELVYKYKFTFSKVVFNFQPIWYNCISQRKLKVIFTVFARLLATL